MKPEEAENWLIEQSDLCMGATSRILEMLKKLAYEEREVTLASGAKSNFYIDCRRVLLISEGVRAAAKALHLAIYRSEWKNTAGYYPAGSGLGGALLAAEIAGCFGSMSHIHVRKEAKGHGMMKRIERGADVPYGAEVIVVDDVATSGGSALDVVNCLSAAGFRVRGIAVLVDRQEGAAEVFKKEDIPFLSLLTPADFR